MLKKINKSLVSALFCTGLVLLGRTTYASDRNTVRLDLDGQTVHIITAAPTVGEALRLHGIEFDDKDIITPSPDTRILNQNPMRVTMQSGFDITVVLDNSIDYTKRVSVNDRIGHVLEYFDDEYTYLDGFLNDALSAGQIINLTSSHLRDYTYTAPIHYSEETVYTYDLFEGEHQIVQEGQFGETVSIFRAHYLGGEEVSRELISTEVALEPINKVIEVGTRPLFYTFESSVGTLGYQIRFTMEATAYSAQQPELSNYTANGSRAVFGVVAVDPRVIPLGTRLYIPGYGIAIAADTGGAIIGHRIDLCFNTVQEAIIFGRRNVEVFVLLDQD